MSRPRTARFGFLAITALCLGVLPSASQAQDANYWTFQYGPVAELLGGQVVGSTRDLSATYYNPGGLALAEDPAFLLSTYAFALESVTVDPVAPGGLLQLSSKRIGPAPSLIAVALPRRWLGEDTHMAFSVLVRQRFDIRLQERLAGDLDDSPGRYGAEALLDQTMNETWAGLTLARRLSDSWGLGLTWYGVFRSQRTRRETNLQTAGASGAEGFTALTIDDFNYSHVRTLAKLGAAWQGRRWRLGLTVTTPGLGLFGHGDAGYTASAEGVDLDGDGSADSLLQDGFAENAPADFRSSWAVAGGAAWRDGRRQLNVTAEWFAPVGPFTIIGLSGAGNSGATFQHAYVQELRSVLNAGFGYEQRLSNSIEVYGAFNTDFSAVPADRSPNVATATWNLYHFTAGTAFTVSGSRFTLGASYALGSNQTEVGGKLPASTPILGEAALPTVHYSRLSFVIGFVFGSGK